MTIDNRESAVTVTTASSFVERLKGLLGHRVLPASEALLIERCGSVHTIGMRFAIDVVFLNRQHQVLKVVGGLQPQRLAMCVGATSVLELASGVCNGLGLIKGAQLRFASPEQSASESKSR